MGTRIVAAFFLPLCLGWAQAPTGTGEQPVVLYKGLGAWHHNIHTSNPEAQKFFDQGLSLMYGFNRYESLRSFRKAVELDPQAAMAYWGMSMAQGPYINMDGEPEYKIKESCEAVNKGLQVSGAPERERAYLEAAAKRCPDFQQPQAYIDAMREVARRWPDDLDAQTIFAESLMIPTRWHWYAADGTAAPGMAEAERTLEEVLRRWPSHPGANHYYIHAVESSRNPERAVPAAQMLMGVVPQAGHMVHMPAHIWLVLGEYELAATLNERAVAVDREYLEASHVQSGYHGYFVHNLHFVTYARWMQGNKAGFRKAADEIGVALAPMATTMPEMADAFSTVTYMGWLRFNDWDEILKMPETKMPAGMAIRHFARAMAFTARKDAAAANGERAAFEAIRKATPADAQFGQNKAADVLAIASAVLDARMAATPEQAAVHWRHAVELQDALVYDEPPAWYYPIRESLGAELLRAGMKADAESVFREGVRRSPKNGRMLFGLMEALRAQGKTEDADSVKREFDAAWSKADVKLNIAEM
jgi:tetratricopeptide (TPR) repeat protein